MYNGQKIPVLFSIFLSFALLFTFVCGCGKKKAAETQGGTQTKENKTDAVEAAMKAVELATKTETAAKKETARAEEKQTAANTEINPKASESAVTTQANKQETEAQQKQGNEELSSVAKSLLPAGMSYELKKTIDDAAYWNLVAQGLYGQKIPDVTLTDIEGKTHKLSDYIGKNVIVFSWAVWCPGCKAQMPFLNMVRKEYGDDKLAILAIAAKTNRDNIEMLREFTAKNEMKYPIFYMDPNDVPKPFNQNMFVPCSYFVSPQGSLKVGLEEIIILRDLKKLVEAP